MSREKCPNCGHKLVAPSGPVKATVLLIGDTPGQEEIIQGHPWAGRGGDVLRAEMIKVGIHPGRCRMTNMWLHAKNPKECDKDWHITEMFREVRGKKFLLIMGAETLQTFLPESRVSEWSGLEIISPDIPKGARAMAMVNPAIALRDVHGEVAFAIKNFAELIRE